MDKRCGLYVSVDAHGKIKRNLTTSSGEIKLKSSSIGNEIIEFSELNFSHYITIIKKIAELSKETECDEPENFGAVKMDVFEKLLILTEDLLDELEKENPIHGVLMKTMLQDFMPIDDGTAEYVYRAKETILDGLESMIPFQFELNNTLEDLSNGIEIDVKEEIEVTQILSTVKDFIPQYYFRSFATYYNFLLISFIHSNPNVAMCKCCGRYFIAKTKRLTLYCDRKIKNGKTCKDVAPALKHKLAGQKSEVISEFDREKQKRYKRAERARDSVNIVKNKYEAFEEYYEWNDNATEARDLYVEGKIPKEEALTIIKGD